MTSVFQKASQIGWVYGALVKPKYDRERWESLLNWINAEAVKKHGFIADLARRLGINDSNVYYWQKGGRPSSKRLEALEACATSLGWIPGVKIEVSTREQVAAAEAAMARLEAEGKELEERMLLERLLKKYPDMVKGCSNASQESLPGKGLVPILQNACEAMKRTSIESPNPLRVEQENEFILP